MGRWAAHSCGGSQIRPTMPRMGGRRGEPRRYRRRTGGTSMPHWVPARAAPDARTHESPNPRIPPGLSQALHFAPCSFVRVLFLKQWPGTVGCQAIGGPSGSRPRHSVTDLGFVHWFRQGRGMMHSPVPVGSGHSVYQVGHSVGSAGQVVICSGHAVTTCGHWVCISGHWVGSCG